MLQLDKITKRFTDGQRQLTVLDGLCLHVDEGEFIAITGESGSGKTTLLSILGTLMPIDEGRYLMKGEEVTVDSYKSPSKKICHLRNKEIGFVYQDHRLLPQFTVLQNILLPHACHKEGFDRRGNPTSFKIAAIHGYSLFERPSCHAAFWR